MKTLQLTKNFPKIIKNSRFKKKHNMILTKDKMQELKVHPY